MAKIHRCSVFFGFFVVVAISKKKLRMALNVWLRNDLQIEETLLTVSGATGRKFPFAEWGGQLRSELLRVLRPKEVNLVTIFTESVH